MVNQNLLFQGSTTLYPQHLFHVRLFIINVLFFISTSHPLMGTSHLLMLHGGWVVTA